MNYRSALLSPNGRPTARKSLRLPVSFGHAEERAFDPMADVATALGPPARAELKDDRGHPKASPRKEPAPPAAPAPAAPAIDAIPFAGLDDRATTPSDSDDSEDDDGDVDWRHQIRPTGSARAVKPALSCESDDDAQSPRPNAKGRARRVPRRG